MRCWWGYWGREADARGLLTARLQVRVLCGEPDLFPRTFRGRVVNAKAPRRESSGFYRFGQLVRPSSRLSPLARRSMFRNTLSGHRGKLWGFPTGAQRSAPKLSNSPVNMGRVVNNSALSEAQTERSSESAASGAWRRAPHVTDAGASLRNRPPTGMKGIEPECWGLGAAKHRSGWTDSSQGRMMPRFVWFQA